MYEDRNTVSVGRSLLSARFLLLVIILVLAAVGLRPGMLALAKRYEKEPIAIRRPLKEFDISHLPSFRDGWKFARRKAPIEDLGTDEYVQIAFTKENPSEDLLYAMLFVTYYSDPRDKVPHTPEVCNRQAGNIVKKMTTITIDTPELAPEHPQIKANLLILQRPRDNSADIYLFCVEGEFRRSREQVRWIIGKPGNRHVYFSKIEVAAAYPTGGDPTQAIEVCKKLLREALPILLAEHFPDKEQLKRR